MGVIYLATDFHLSDPYVAIMKSRIHLIVPNIKIIDLSHDIRNFDIEYGAWFLYYCYKNLEKPSIICMVVDPGVGTNRKAIIVKIQKSFFILPDNGLISVILKDPYFKEKDKVEYYEILPLKLKELYLKKIKKFEINYEISNTFHGRDIFAPATGFIARNTKYIKDFTIKIQNIFINENIIFPQYLDFKKQNIYKGKFVYFDHFGNLFTNLYLDNSFLENKNDNLSLKIIEKDQIILELNSISRTFGFKKKNEFLFYRGSFGFIEFAKNQNSAFMEWDDWQRIKNFDVIIEKI